MRKPSERDCMASDEVEFCSCAPGTTSIHAAMAGLDHVPPYISKYSVSLKHLYLGNNNISKIENLDSIRDLETLELWGNEISAIENIGSLPSLQVLRAGGNPISSRECASGRKRYSRVAITC